MLNMFNILYFREVRRLETHGFFCLTHLVGWDRMVTILLATNWSSFSWLKIVVFWFEFHYEGATPFGTKDYNGFWGVSSSLFKRQARPGTVLYNDLVRCHFSKWLKRSSQQTHTLSDIYGPWSNGMDTFSTLLAFCGGNLLDTGGFTSQKTVNWSFDALLHVGLTMLVNKQSSYLWFETLWHSCDITTMHWN